MNYTSLFENIFASSLVILTSCGSTHGDPFMYTNLSGEIGGSNDFLLKFLDVEKIEQIASINEWLYPQGVELSYILSHSGEYRGKALAKTKRVEVIIRTEVIALGDEFIVAVVLQDRSALERALLAERYFERFKKKLLTTISHEFRTPMNAIIGFADLLRSSPLSSWQQEYIDLVGKSASSMMRNIENLLELMQVESGGIHTNLQPFNPFDVYESFSMQFDELLLAKELKMSILIDPRLPLKIMGDQDKILTILRNIMQNAIKFTPQSGQILLEILIIKEENNKIEVEYAVSDTGSGIESSRMKTLLRPFSSAWENQRHGQDGMGVGLALSHKYIDMMESQLMLASEVGRGSRFSFRIVHEIEDESRLNDIKGKKIALYSHEPHATQSVLLEKYFDLFNLDVQQIDSLVNPELNACDVLLIDVPHLSISHVESLKITYPHLQIVAVMDVESQAKRGNLRKTVEAIIVPPFLPSTLHKMFSMLGQTVSKETIVENRGVASESETTAANAKILVAEDNPINLRLLETILKQHHFQVVAVDNGQKAVDAYLKEPFDLVLMDIDMPVMDGLTANRLIKEIDKRDHRGFIPVIALTAHALIGDRERIIRAGLDAHLAKPIDKNFLLKTIDRYLQLADQKRKGLSV
jgi:signal transduction histidine kinase/ActR/RegA family two-component response regulator